ncbi:hypothetical protein M218_25950 [Burkholderia pseudomallei MSHR338]|nr:hypothetical protein M218_25950 [Burkholderia pseudomallei MSHR338]
MIGEKVASARSNDETVTGVPGSRDGAARR